MQAQKATMSSFELHGTPMVSCFAIPSDLCDLNMTHVFRCSVLGMLLESLARILALRENLKVKLWLKTIGSPRTSTALRPIKKLSTSPNGSQ